MCGIAGYSTLATGAPLEPAWLAPMLDSLAHRGPDDQGAAVFDQVAFGNRRLSIIDLEGGRQPIANEDGSVVVVYNGEMYNSPDLRAELLAKGHAFKTRTDTEVLVHLYEEEGEGFLKRLDGMFALALLDQRRGELYLARDRFGVKPLFWSFAGGLLAFASEIKALRTLPGFDPALDDQALAIFLGLFFIPDPWTIYKGVRRLQAGHYLKLSREGLAERQYHDLDYARPLSISAPEAEAEVARLLRAAVARQMLSDVPVGVLLSGGLDSRSMLAAASEHEQGVTSFTISFDEALYDESSEAGLFAKMFNSPHQIYRYGEEDFLRDFLPRQRHLDEPFGPWSNVAMEGLARFIRQRDFKVVLSGAGGDELFLGYPTVHAANLARLYRLLPRWLRQGVIKPLARRLPAGASRLPLSFKIKSFVEADADNPVRTFFGFKEVLRRETWPGLLTPEALARVGGHDPYMVYQQYLPRLEGLPLVDALAYLDFRVFLQGCIFFAQDNAYMARSVEQRVPFMDNELVEFACRLPLSLRFHPFKLKVLLRRALAKHFPPPPAYQGEQAGSYRKNGFEVPGNLWLHQGGFGGLMRRVLSRERLEAAGFFQPEAVAALLEDHLARRQNNERLLQTIGSLTLFLDGSYQV